MKRPFLSLFASVLLFSSTTQAQDLNLIASVSDNNGFATSCNGASDGSIDLSVSGGIQPYTFIWATLDGSVVADGATTEDLTGLSSGTYTVIVTDSVGDADTLNLFLTSPTVVSISLYSPAYNGFNVHCYGGSTGEINASVSGGVAPYTYAWSTGDSLPDIGGLTAGTYQLVVTGANGCIDTASITLNEPLDLTTAITSPASASGLEIACEGDASGNIDLTVSGGAGGYSFNWSNGGITEDLNNLNAGWYSVQVEDANNCSKYDSLEVREPAPLEGDGMFFEYQPGEFFSCDTCEDAQVTATATGGTQPYTFTLTSGGQTVVSHTGGTSFTVNDLSSNVWYVGTITDAAGCADVDSFMIPANPMPEPLDVIGSVSSYPGGYQVSSFEGEDGWIDIQIEGGTGPYSYSWSTVDGSSIADGASTQDLNTLAAGTYSVIVTDADSEQVEKAFSLNQPSAPLQATVDGVIPQCYGSNDGQLEVFVSGGVHPYTYLWSNGVLSSRISGLTPGAYSVTVYDANNDSIVLNDTLPEVTEILTSISPSFDDLGYQMQCAFDDTTRLDLQVTGGVSPYSYQWDNGKFNQDIYVYSGGWYHVIVTDGNGCQRRDSILINTPAEPEMDAQWHTYANGELFSCDTCNDAQLNLVITGAITPVSMTLSSNTQTISGPAFTGIYADTVYDLRFEDGLGCVMEMTGEEALTIPREGFSSLGVTAELSQYPGGYNVSTHGGDDGWIDLDVFGQMSQETVLWSDGSADKYRSGLSAGTYEVTVSDNAGQSVTKSWTLSQPGASLTATVIGPATPCELFVPLTANVMGGSPPYSYTWLNPLGDTIYSSILNVTQEGLHHLMVVDANGDTSTTSYLHEQTILEAEVDIPNVLGDYSLDCEGQGGSATITMLNGTPPYNLAFGFPGMTILDTTIQSNQLTLPSESLMGDHTDVVITDATGCSSIRQVVFSRPMRPFVSDVDWHLYPGGNLFSCDTCNDARMSLIFDAHLARITKLYATHDTYASGTSNVNVDSLINVMIQNHTFKLEASDHTLYGPDFLGIHADTDYQMVIESVDGCVWSQPDTMSIPQDGFNSLQVSAELSNYPGGYNVSGNGNQDGYINLNISGAVSMPQIVWSDSIIPSTVPGTTALPEGMLWSRYDLPAGTYEVTVSDNAGQSVTRSWTLTEPAAPLSVAIGDQSNGCGSSVYLEAYANGGTPPYTFTWSDPQGNAVGDGFSFLSGTTAEFDEGYYNILVVDANGDSITNAYLLTHQMFSVTASSPEIAGYNVSCDDGDGSMTLTFNGGMPPFSLSIYGADGYNDHITVTDTVSQLDSLFGGTYWFSVNDANGCYSNTEITLTPEPLDFADAAWHTYPNGELFSCDTCNDAQVTVELQGGVPPYTITMESASQILTGPAFTGIYADTLYAVRVIDARGCEVLDEGEDGFLIPRGGFNTLQVSAEVSSYAGGYHISSHGENDGWIGLQINGMMSMPHVTWSDTPVPQEQAFYREGLTAGTYTVTVTDNAGQSVTKSWTLTQPASQLTGYLELTDPSCHNTVDGEVQANVNGGVPPYSYLWSASTGSAHVNGSTNANISGLEEGAYSIVILDAANDTLVLTDTLVAPNEVLTTIVPSVDTLGYHLLCPGDLVTLDLTPTGGTPPYTFVWEGGGFAEDRTTDKPGVNVVQVKDDLGCTKLDTFTVVAPTAGLEIEMEPYVYPNGTFFSCGTCNDGRIAFTPVGGVPPYDMQLTGLGTLQGDSIIDVPADSMITFVLTDALGCQFIDGGSLPRGDVSSMFNLDVSATLSQYAGGYNISCHGCNNGSIELHINGGIPPYQVVWNTMDSTTMLNGLVAGTYSVYITDQNGNEFSKDYTLTQPSNPLAVNLNGSFSNCMNQGTLNAMASGGVPPYVFKWEGPSGVLPDAWEEITVFETGSYTLTVSDANADSLLSSFDLQYSEPLQVQVNAPLLYGNAHAGCVGFDGSMEMSITGGTPPYDLSVYGNMRFERDQNGNNWFNYHITTTETTIIIDSLAAGEYQIQISDFGNCNHAYESMELQARPMINASITAEQDQYGNYFSCDTCLDGQLTGVVDAGLAGATYNWYAPPIELLQGNRIEGTSIFLNSFLLNQTDLNMNDPFAQTFYVGSGQDFSGVEPEKPYLLHVQDGTGCSGYAAVMLERPKPTVEPLNNAWGTRGNLSDGTALPDTGSAGSEKWLGTADSADFVMKANNEPQLRLRADGGTEVLGALILPNMPAALPCDRRMLSIGENGLVEAWGPCPPEDCELRTPWSAPPNGSTTDVALCHTYENVGIGHVNPTHKLHVSGTGYFAQEVGIGTSADDNVKLLIREISQGHTGIKVEGRHESPALEITELNDDPYFTVMGNGQVKIVGNTEGSSAQSIPMLDISADLSSTLNGPAIQVHSNGKVNLGQSYSSSATHSDYRLSVNGKVLAKEIYVTMDNWSDFVFDENYELIPLDELKSFIAENNHLPDVPSEAEILEEGNNLGQMDAILLQKIEELTLYVLELNDKLEQVKEENAELRTQLK